MKRGSLPRKLTRVPGEQVRKVAQVVVGMHGPSHARGQLVVETSKENEVRVPQHTELVVLVDEMKRKKSTPGGVAILPFLSEELRHRGGVYCLNGHATGRLDEGMEHVVVVARVMVLGIEQELPALVIFLARSFA
jgi:hypothetical protein